MKDPRPQDYDPTYKRMATAEDFDISELTPIAPKPRSVKNELTERIPNATRGPRKKLTQSNRTAARPEPSPSPNVRAVRPVRVPDQPAKKNIPSPTPSNTKPKREIKRHAFEFYRDQIPKLNQLKAEFMVNGSDKSMSAMVREAVDDYINSHTP
jgi:hypothetical protein